MSGPFEEASWVADTLTPDDYVKEGSRGACSEEAESRVTIHTDHESGAQLVFVPTGCTYAGYTPRPHRTVAHCEPQPQPHCNALLTPTPTGRSLQRNRRQGKFDSLKYLSN